MSTNANIGATPSQIKRNTQTSSTGNSKKPERLFPYEKWRKQLPELRAAYVKNTPFPHIALDQFVEDALLREANKEFPSAGSPQWTQYKHFNENKMGQTRRELFPQTLGALIDELQSPEFVGFLSELTGIPNLVADLSLDGGGIHISERGGFLNVHTDFRTHHVHQNWARRANLLVYLNTEWKDEWNGHLELWNSDVSECVKKYAPIFNRAIVFTTDGDSFHGHPTPLNCPVEVARKSIALYYFTVESELKLESTLETNYRPVPTDSAAKAALIWADKQAIRVYSSVKRRLKFSDDTLSKVLGVLFGRKK